MFTFTKKQTLPTTLAVAMISFLNASTAWAETQSFDLSGFEGISAAEGIHVHVTNGATFEVVAESDDNRQLEYLKLIVQRGVLHAEMDNGLLAPEWVTGDKLTIRIVMPALIQAEASSGARVEVEMINGSDLDVAASSGASLLIDAADGGTMQVDVSSGANVRIAGGTCASVSADVSGGSFLDMHDVTCANADIDASSGSTASVHADNAIDANASSGATIRIFGAHKDVSTNDSGGGTVILQ
jgi:hypothetical protein